MNSTSPTTSEIALMLASSSSGVSAVVSVSTAVKSVPGCLSNMGSETDERDLLSRSSAALITSSPTAFFILTTASAASRIDLK